MNIDCKSEKKTHQKRGSAKMRGFYQIQFKISFIVDANHTAAEYFLPNFFLSCRFSNAVSCHLTILFFYSRKTDS